MYGQKLIYTIITYRIKASIKFPSSTKRYTIYIHFKKVCTYITCSMHSLIPRSNFLFPPIMIYIVYVNIFFKNTLDFHCSFVVELVDCLIFQLIGEGVKLPCDNPVSYFPFPYPDLTFFILFFCSL